MTILSDPGRGLSPQQQPQMDKMNSITMIDSADVCIHEVIRQFLVLQPEATAVSAWDGDISYGELKQLSSALTASLQSRGVGPEDLIPLCFEKSRMTIIGLLGVLQAGAGFVMLDPQHPVDRLREICKDVKAPLILASIQCEKLARTLGPEIQILQMEALKAEVGVSDVATAIACTVRPSNAAYVVFTSGTTGKPKGVVIEHAAFSTMAFALIERVRLGPQDRVLQFSSYAFDVSISDQLVTLMSGGCICVPSENQRTSDLIKFINEYRVNCAFLTPSVARLIPPSSVPSLKVLGLGGESVSTADVNSWSPHVRLLGLYGPAECAVTSTVNADLACSPTPTVIGHPLAVNCRVVDPDDHNRHVPQGVVGELLISGPTLSRGYLNNTEKTKSAFVISTWVDPQGQEALVRSYRTGDLVRCLADGSLLYIGRKDTQIKINGQRVELGEIEHQARKVFADARDVIAGVVHAHGKLPVLTLFVAYPCVDVATGSCDLFQAPSEDFAARVREAESRLKEVLPKYMVPKVFLPINFVPITKSGKTDRHMLHQHAAELPVEAWDTFRGCKPSSERPLTATEMTLRKEWARLLNITATDINHASSWFHLGGDSLLAMKLIGALRERQLHLTLQDITENPTLAAMSKRTKSGNDTLLVQTPSRFELLNSGSTMCSNLARELAEKAGHTLNTVEDIYPCTRAQTMLIQLSQNIPANYTLLFEASLVPGLNEDRLRDAWRRVVEAHPMLRTRIVQSGNGEFFQVILKDATIDIESMASSGGDFNPSFNTWGLDQPLLRAGIVGAKFAILIHHVVYDIASFVILRDDLERAFHGDILLHRPFSPFVKWDRTFDDITKEFWARKLSGVRHNVFPPSPSKDHIPMDTSKLEFTISMDERNHGKLNVPSKLYLALAIALSQATDSNDVVFGGVFARRAVPVVNVSEIAAPTTSVLPVRIQVDPNTTFGAARETVHNELLEMDRFSGADIGQISKCSPEAAAACDIRTIMVLQPDVLNGSSTIFSTTKYHHDMPCCAGLVLLCYLSAHGVSILARYDEVMIGKARVRRLLNQLAHNVHVIESSPERKIVETA